MKTCAKCGGRGPFYRTKATKDGLSRNCSECVKSTTRAWRKANPERAKASCAEWYRANRAHAITKAKAWQHAHPERARDWDRERARKIPLEVKRARMRSWCARNRIKNNLKQQRRRARLRCVASTLTETQWMDVLETFGFACAYCLRSNISLTIDHVVPIVRVGANTADNVVPSCGTCNRQKGPRGILVMAYRTPIVWQKIVHK
jgi:5-methylcytosine-specific restriction endonuclease McrA